MKKLKMIVTSVIVLAIVGSAFAFNAKKAGSFCVSDSTTSSSCSNIVHTLKRTTTGDQNNKYYPGWDGSIGACTGSLCTAAVTLVQD